MKLLIDLDNKTARLVYQTINPNSIQWFTPPGTDFTEGTLTKPDGEEEIVGCGLSFDGSLDIAVFRGGKNLSFQVVGDGLK